MASIFDTRRANLRTLIQQWGGPSSLAAQLGHTNGSFLAQLAGPRPSKDVSEKVAREIERRLNLPAGWMDRSTPAGATRRNHNEPDTAALVDIVARVHDLAGAARVKLSREKFTTVVELAYEQTKLSGKLDEQYLQRLIQLAT